MVWRRGLSGYGVTIVGPGTRSPDKITTDNPIQSIAAITTAVTSGANTATNTKLQIQIGESMETPCFEISIEKKEIPSVFYDQPLARLLVIF